MEFESIKKNKPKLTDYAYLQKIVEIKNSQTPVIIEPTLIEKIIKKIKNNIYTFIENNLFAIIIAFIIVCFLIYRFIIYRSIKNAKPVKKSYVEMDCIPMNINTSIKLEKESEKESEKKQKKKHNKKYKNKLSIIHENETPNEQDLLNITNDRSLTGDTKNLQIINSSSYAPYNLRDLGGLYSWNQNNNFNLLN